MFSIKKDVSELEAWLSDLLQRADHSILVLPPSRVTPSPSFTLHKKTMGCSLGPQRIPTHDTLDRYYSLACTSALLLINSSLNFCKSSWVIVFSSLDKRQESVNTQLNPDHGNKVWHRDTQGETKQSLEEYGPNRDHFCRQLDLAHVKPSELNAFILFQSFSLLYFILTAKTK